MLQLPPSIEIVRAQVLLLRLTIPVDIYASPIVAEVDGVEGHIKVLSDTELSKANNKSLRKMKYGVKPSTTDVLPTPTELAQSFLQTEASDEREELEKAIMSNSQISTDEDDESVVGTGTGLSLPGFMANFLKGIVDRLQVRVHGITLNLDVDVPNEGGDAKTMETVTVQIKVEDLDIEGVTFGGGDGGGGDEKAEIKKPTVLPLKGGKRLISFRNLRGVLISDAGLFSDLARSSARSSAMTSPNATHADLQSLRSPETSQKSFGGGGGGSVTESQLSMAQSFSTVENENESLESSEVPASFTLSQHGMGQSIASSGRFDDAPEEDEDDGPPNFEDERPASSFMGGLEESALQSAFLDHIAEQQRDKESDDSDANFPFNSSRRSRLLDKRSKESTPRASLIMSKDSQALKSPSPRTSESPGQKDMAEMIASASNIVLEDNSPRGRSGHATPTRYNSDPDLSPERHRQPLAFFHSFGPPSDTSSTSGDERLMESKLFSPEEAESMYESAFSEGFHARMPGGWDHESEYIEERRRPSLIQPEASAHVPEGLVEAARTLPLHPMAEDVPAKSHNMDGPNEASQDSNPGTPRARSIHKADDNISESSSDGDTKLGKQLFNLDHVGIYLPPTTDEQLAESLNVKGDLAESTAQSVTQSVLGDTALPGTFSYSSPVAKARQSGGAKEQRGVPSLPKKGMERKDVVEVVLGQLYAQFDVSVARLMYRLFGALAGVFDDGKSEKKNASADTEEAPSAQMAVKLHVERFSLKFLDRLAGERVSRRSFNDKKWTKPPTADVLLRTTLKGLDIDYSVASLTTRASLTLQKFVFGYAKENILSFDASKRLGESVRDLSDTAGVDISMEMTKSQHGTRVIVSTLPVHVSISLQKLDETFGWFGGLSSVLNMTSSMASASATSASSIKTKPKGVRFDTPIMPNDTSAPIQHKVDARIGGLVVDLIGKECSIGLDTSALKIISRDSVIGLGIDNIKLTGPHLGEPGSDPAIRAVLHGTQVKFLQEPQHTDLDRLLALITPSRSKYGGDDDILLDTLLRQRRQGSVLRVTVEEFKGQMERLEELKYLPQLGVELSKLSTVAKYLPEDDRPGILNLVLVKEFDVSVDVNNTLGAFRTRMTDINLAQITLPSLVAASIGTLSIHRNISEEVIVTATNAELRPENERAPGIMARMIGDEMEPTVKIKLWNIRVEYQVPTIMAFMLSMGLGPEATTEDIATAMAVSIATLTDRKTVSTAAERGERKNKHLEGKPLNVDLVIRDCVIGLNPLALPSKVLFVMTEAHVSAVLPEDNNTNGQAELTSGTLMLINDVKLVEEDATPRKNKRYSYDQGSTQVATLQAQGFVSIGYITSAKAVLNITSGHTPDDKCVAIEIRDDLFVLETCADSTETLIAAMGALAPPSPPSQEKKYRTEVVPMEDLMASFTGDAFDLPDDEFDFDNQFDSHMESDIERENPGLEIDEEYYTRSKLMAGNPDIRSPGSSHHGSILFDQDGAQDDDDHVMIESFHAKQHVHLGAHEPLEFKEDHFGTGSVIEGTAHRWNSAKNEYDTSNCRIKESPLTVCVRDVNIIWNLFDGYDWPATRGTISAAIDNMASKDKERKAKRAGKLKEEGDFMDEEEIVIGDFLFNSIYIGVPSNKDPRDFGNLINQGIYGDNMTETESRADTTTTATTATTARPGIRDRSPRIKGAKVQLRRSKHHKITFELKGCAVDMVAFPPHSGETQSSIDIRIRDFDIYDHISTSTWKKFATYMHDFGPREAGRPQIHIELLTVRPVPELAANELVLRATALPIRLHVDQDALDFITRFFEFKDPNSQQPTPSGEPPFIQRAEVMDIVVKLDFKPKRVDYAGIRSGHTTEFMNFVILDSAELTLRHTILYGVSGFPRLGEMLNDVWMPEVKRNQLPGILSGLAPVRSFANFFGGVHDLVTVPIREYKKNGKVVRALGMGVNAFGKKGGIEVLRFGAKLAVGAQNILEGVEGVVGAPGDRKPSSYLRGIGDEWEGASEDEGEEEEERQISHYANQPIGIASGLRGAYKALERDLVLAKDAIIAVPGEVMESGSAKGALGVVARRAPTVVIRPMVGVSKAVGGVMMGVGNWWEPENLRRVGDVSYSFLMIMSRY